jgi:DNA polymerase-3 subunit beta
MRVDKRHFAWDFDGLSVIAPRLEGGFPNWKQLVPATTPTSLSVDREALTTAIRRVEAVVGPAGGAVPLRLSPSEAGVEVAGVAQDIGTIRERLSAAVVGEPPAIAFNPGFFRGCLDVLEGDQAVIGLVDALKPATIAEAGLLTLLMPVRIS